MAFFVETALSCYSQRRLLPWKPSRQLAAAIKLLAFALVLIFVLHFLSDTLISSFGSSSVITIQGQSRQTVDFGSHQRQRQPQPPLRTSPRIYGENWRNGSLFRNRPLVLLSIDYHQSPVQDLIDLLGPLGVRFMQKGVMTYGCQFFNSCRSTGSKLKDWVTGRAFHWLMSDSWKWSLYNKYRTDPDWQSADAFLCFHPSSTCELFTPFKKPIIVLSTIRVDNGRTMPWSRRAWLDTLRTRIAADSRNTVAANNRFDVEYTRYFTGVNATLLPSYCGYTRTFYNPTRSGFLVYRPERARSFTNLFMREWNRVCRYLGFSDENSKARLAPVDDLYEQHKFVDLASHKGIVNLPVQPSMMSIFEQYRMNIPLFFPSRSLLVSWQLNHDFLTEINLYGSWAAWFQPDSSQVAVPHPCDKTNASQSYWLQFCDWYSLPHVFYYESIEHLAVMLNRITDSQLLEVSNSMRIYNEQFRHELVEKWRNILFRIGGSVTNF